MGELNILTLILEASLVVKLVMGFLFFLSFLGWALIFRLHSRLRGAIDFDDEFELWFWSGESLDRQFQLIAQDNERGGLEQVFYVGYEEYKTAQRMGAMHNDVIQATERKFKVVLGKQQAMLEKGLSTLASIGSVSPYIGLFGTVWGIMTAFIGLSSAQNVTLATVAPGIAEALIATAIGLFAAIPATLAYNHFTAKANFIYENRALFCDSVIGLLAHQNIHAIRHKGQA